MQEGFVDATGVQDLFFEAQAVIHPRAVMIHQKHASVAHRAMMGPHRFNVVTLLALLFPGLLEL
jgi:hypothetical protein